MPRSKGAGHGFGIGGRRRAERTAAEARLRAASEAAGFTGGIQGSRNAPGHAQNVAPARPIVPGVEVKRHEHAKEDRHHAALHGPLPSTMMVGLSRYAEEMGGGMVSRLVVAKYSTIEQGFPVWHVSIEQYRDGVAVDIDQWTRAERRRAERWADKLVEHHGEGEVLRGGIGLRTDRAVQRLRKLTRAEMGHVPPEWLQYPSIKLLEVE